MKKNTYGFTIIELLVVLVVVATLAAISLVTYRGIQARAAESRLATQLSQARKDMELYYIEHGKWPFEDDARAACAAVGIQLGDCGEGSLVVQNYLRSRSVLEVGRWCNVTGGSMGSAFRIMADGRLLWGYSYSQEGTDGDCEDGSGWRMQDRYWIGEKHQLLLKEQWPARRI